MKYTAVLLNGENVEDRIIDAANETKAYFNAYNKYGLEVLHIEPLNGMRPYCGENKRYEDTFRIGVEGKPHTNYVP